MILKDFYTEKKARLINEANVHNITKVSLYNDNVFSASIAEPLLMFKYDNIKWQSTSEKIHNGEVTFCIYIVLPSTGQDYESVFDVAHSVDKAILFNTNTAGDLIDEKNIFKAGEKQYSNELDNWDKTKYFIWEMTYKTFLVDTSIKKKYNLIYNGHSQSDLIDMGYDLTSGTDGNYIGLYNQNTVKGKLFINTSSNESTNFNGTNEASIIKNSDLDNDSTEDNSVTLDENGDVIAFETIDTIGNKVKNVDTNEIDSREIKVVEIKK